MSRLKQVVVLWLLVLILVSSSSTGQSRTQADSIPPLVLDIEPADHVVSENHPAAFAVVIRNPSQTEARQVFLTVGANTMDETFSMDVADSEPWFESENKTLWAKNLHLAPGEHEFIGIVVYSDSPAGTHEINATAAFLHDGNYTRESSVSNVTIPDFSSTTEPTTSPLPSPWVPLAAIVDWLEDNWVWLIPFFSLVVAVLSFFGYERVRGVLADERKADERGE